MWISRGPRTAWLVKKARAPVVAEPEEPYLSVKLPRPVDMCQDHLPDSILKHPLLRPKVGF